VKGKTTSSGVKEIDVEAVKREVKEEGVEPVAILLLTLLHRELLCAEKRRKEERARAGEDHDDVGAW
jgi:hypothetical protein